MIKNFENPADNAEDKKFFDDLIGKYKREGYDFDQDHAHIIIKKDGKRFFIRKWRRLDLVEGGYIEIEDHIRKVLGIDKDDDK